MRSTRPHRRKPDGKIEGLRATPALSTLTNDELVRLAAVADLVDFPAGATLTREGELARHAFLLVDGEVRILTCGAELDRLGPGRFVGDVALLDHLPRSTTVEAVTDTRALAFDEPGFASLVEERGWFVRRLLSQLAGRVRVGAPT